MRQYKITVSIADIIELLILIIGVWALSPVVKNSINQMYPVFVAIVCIILIIMDLGGKLPKSIALIFLFLGLLILYKVLGISDDSWANHSNPFMYFFTMAASLYMYKRFPGRKIKRDGIILFCVFVVNLFHQFYLYFALGRVSLYNTNDLLRQGIVAGSTSFVADAMFIGMFCAVLCFLDIDTKAKTACILVLIATIYYIYNIQTRATALIFISVFIAACFVIGFSPKITPSRVVIFFSSCAAAVFAVPNIIYLLAHSGNEYYARKFMAIVNFFTAARYSYGGTNQSSFATRIYVAGVSLKTWLSSVPVFLFGKGYDAGFYDVSGIGRHSELIDLFPRYGLLGVSIAGAAVINYYKTILYCIDSSKRQYLFLVIALLIYSAFNGVFFPDMGYVVNLIVPSVIMCVELKEGEE